MSFDPSTFLQNSDVAVQLVAAWRVAIAAALGALLGIERSIAGKHAGMRTYALVSAGSALFVVVGALASYLFAGFPGSNPLQIASTVIIGIGFIGSGLAYLRGDHPAEITTASGVWMAAGIGMACGFGFFLLGFAATVLAILVFSFLLKLENILRRRFETKGE